MGPVLLIAIATGLGLGLVGLGVFLWNLRSGQYDDLEGAAERVLLADAPPGPRNGQGAP